MSVQDYDALAADLIGRVNDGIDVICRTAVDTGVHFKLEDIVDYVEEHLPAGYARPSAGPTRREVVRMITADILNEALADPPPGGETRG